MELPERSVESPRGGRLFCLGRWITLLEQCLRLLGEKAASTRGFHHEKYFNAKREENLFNVVGLIERLSSGSDLGASTNGADVLDYAENQFCELAADYFRLKVFLLSRCPLEHEEELHPYEEAFAKRQFDWMFPKREDGSGLSLNFRPLGVPSLDWFRGGGEPGACFHLLDLAMESLVEVSASAQLDFAELANLGLGSAEVERLWGEAEAGTIFEPEAAKFWAGMAASLLSNTLAVDRLLLVDRRRRIRAIRDSPSSSSADEGDDNEDDGGCPPPTLPVFSLNV